MKVKPIPTDQRAELEALIISNRLNIPKIAAAIGMPESTFKVKLATSRHQYRFSDSEYAAVLTYLETLGKTLFWFVKKEKHALNKKHS